MIAKIKAEVENNTELLVEIRRYFHSIPELGLKENKTASRIAEILGEWGLDVHQGDGKTGVVGLLRGGKPGKTIAIRADIDALPIQEQTGLEFASTHPGVMHACGHDGHITIALGAAKVLSALKSELAGNVKFIFQPAEEGPGGAELMIEEGVLKGPEVDAVLGLHIWPEIDSGSIGITRGPIMAAADRFDIKIIGVGGHGAVPHKAIDPLLIASKVVTTLQNLVSREVDPLEAAVISVCSFNAGTAFNIIPATAELSGTVRTFSLEARENIAKRIEGVVKGITTALKAEYEFKYHYWYPPTINDDGFTDFFKGVAEEIIGKKAVQELARPSMGAEDFSFYLQNVPGTYFFLGTRNEEKGINKPIHHPEYTIDEDVLSVGVELFCAAVYKYLSR